MRPATAPNPKKVLEKVGLDRVFLPLLKFLLLRLVRLSTVPPDPEQIHLDPSKPVCYALHLQQLSSLLVLDEAARRLNLPSPLAPLTSGGLNERSEFFYLTRTGQPSPLRPKPYKYPRRLERIVCAARRDPQMELQIVPVSVFWGRAPQKQESVLRALLAETWVVPGAFKQFLRLLIHGRDTMLKFGDPIDLRTVMARAGAEGLDEHTSVRRVARLLRAVFRRERELAVGPNLSHRQTLLNEIVDSPAVQQAVAAQTRQKNVSKRQAELAARRMAYGIASDYSYSAIRALELLMSRLWNRLYDGIQVHRFEDVGSAGAGAELVYVPCHRSHIDYLLLSYVIYHRGLLPPHIAAGDNLNLPFVGSILRRAGAFFLRRGFKGDAVYTTVFAEYLHAILSRGFPIEYFVEGGRSRTGRMLAPKAGLLAMTVDSVVRGIRRPVVFIPVYIGYERVFEGESYIAELSGKPKKKESIWGIVTALRKLDRRFGKVHVNIGAPIHLDQHLDRTWPAWRVPEAATDDEQQGARHAAVADLASTIVTRINDALVINPINLIAVAMLGSPRRAMDAGRLAEQVDLLKQLLTAVPYSQRQQLTELDGEAVVAYGEELGVIERNRHSLGDIFVVPSSQAVLMGYFRNNVLHAFALPALIACLVAQNGRIEPPRIEEIARRCYPVLRAELFLSWPEEELAPRLQGYLDAFRSLNLVREHGLWIGAPAPSQRESLALHSLAQAIRQPLERYFIVVATLVRFGSGRLSPRLLENCCVLLAQRLAYLHEGAGPEFFDRAALRAIIETLSDIGLVAEVEDRIHFPPQLERSAEDAAYLLPHEVRLAISHVTQLTEDDIVLAVEASGTKR
ncbi:MAG: glycerol-3-phosphate 1-O-acyltransferase PlsB [Rhodocyclaceae bacterium]